EAGVGGVVAQRLAQLANRPAQDALTHRRRRPHGSAHFLPCDQAAGVFEQVAQNGKELRPQGDELLPPPQFLTDRVEPERVKNELPILHSRSACPRFPPRDHLPCNSTPLAREFHAFRTRVSSYSNRPLFRNARMTQRSNASEDTSGRADGPVRLTPETTGPLSPARAFVVQFRERAAAPGHGFAGRVEHVITGHA